MLHITSMGFVVLLVVWILHFETSLRDQFEMDLHVTSAYFENASYMWELCNILSVHSFFCSVASLPRMCAMNVCTRMHGRALTLKIADRHGYADMAQ